MGIFKTDQKKEILFEESKKKKKNNNHIIHLKNKDTWNDISSN